MTKKLRKPMSQETKDKISSALKGQKRPKEVCEKISWSLTGRNLTDEHKDNISSGCKKFWNYVRELTKLDG